MRSTFPLMLANAELGLRSEMPKLKLTKIKKLPPVAKKI